MGSRTRSVEILRRRLTRFLSDNRNMPKAGTGSAPLDYYILDVFTSTPLAGNPLAVVFDTVGLETDRMQAIAREFNLSETTFVQRRSAEIEKNEGVRVRIFTTQEELPFAGHPTLGTSAILRRQAPETLLGDELRLSLNVGSVPVRFVETAEGEESSFAEMTQRDPEFGAELNPSEIAPLLGLKLNDMDLNYRPQVVSTGNAFAIVLLRNIRVLESLRVQQEEATRWLRERNARWFYVLAPTFDQSSGAPKFRARMQFYGGEDPATGSAAGCAISYLVARGLVASEQKILLRQGVEIDRPSNLFLSAKFERPRVTHVRVGGSTVLVAKGQLFLP